MSITPSNKRALKHSCYSIVPVKRKSLHFIQKNILIPNSQGKLFSHKPPQINKRYYSSIPKTNISFHSDSSSGPKFIE